MPTSLLNQQLKLQQLYSCRIGEGGQKPSNTFTLKIGTFFAYSTKPSALKGVKYSPSMNSLNLTNLIFMLRRCIPVKICIPVSSDLAQLSP